MAVNARNLSGGISFFDLPGELRNAIYEHFIDLMPSVKNAINLACVHKQIHSEFGVLFVLQSNLIIDFEDLNDFLHHFFVRCPNPALEDLHCYLRVESFWCSSNSLDMLAVAAVLHEYPLFQIEWCIECACGYCLCDVGYDGFTFAQSFLTDMAVDHFNQLVSAKVSYEQSYGRSRLRFVTGKGISRQTVENWRLICKDFVKFTVYREDREDFEDFDSDDETDSDNDDGKSEGGSESSESEQED
ncbi:unnamed protein product [Alternaria burnsii]|nr:unnamed protein product [Alternaria burnsii]